LRSSGFASTAGRASQSVDDRSATGLGSGGALGLAETDAGLGVGLLDFAMMMDRAKRIVTFLFERPAKGRKK